MKGHCVFLHSKDEKPSQGEMTVTQSKTCTLHQTPKPEPLLWLVWPPASASQRNTRSFSCGLSDLIEDWNLLSSQDGENGAAGQTLTPVGLNPAGSDSLSPTVKGDHSLSIKLSREGARVWWKPDESYCCGPW